MVALADISWLPQPPAWSVDWPAILGACPWLVPLADTPQDPAYHGEGDVLIHTRMVAEALAGLPAWCDLPPAARAALFLAALLHDVGKPATTETAPDGRISSPGHARLGASIARGLLWGDEGLGAPLAFAERELVVALVRLHGLPLWFLERSDIARAVLPASLRVRLDLVALLAEADVRGRVCADGEELLGRVGLFRDWCGIYLPPARLHWSLAGLPEQIENHAAQEAYWELEKFLTLALKANPNLLECLYTPLVEHATPLAEELRAMRDRFLSKHLYQTYNGYVLSQFHRMEQDLRTHGAVRLKHAMHLIRLLLSGIVALREGAIPVRVTEQRERLLAIKRGELPWPEVDAWRLELHQQFDAAYAASALPERPDSAAADAFLIRARRMMVED